MDTYLRVMELCVSYQDSRHLFRRGAIGKIWHARWLHLWVHAGGEPARSNSVPDDFLHDRNGRRSLHSRCCLFLSRSCGSLNAGDWSRYDRECWGGDWCCRDCWQRTWCWKACLAQTSKMRLAVSWPMWRFLHVGSRTIE